MSEKEDKAARLAAALRANLKRRKAQARGADVSESEPILPPATDDQRRTSQ